MLTYIKKLVELVEIKCSGQYIHNILSFCSKIILILNYFPEIKIISSVLMIDKASKINKDQLT
jgi:hypothetical protein